MNPSLRDQVKEWTKQHPEYSPKKKKHVKKPQKRKPERLTESDIRSLMGIDRPTYSRHRGAFRQK